jgi:hypothetical protein
LPNHTSQTILSAQPISCNITTFYFNAKQLEMILTRRNALNLLDKSLLACTGAFPF